MEVLRPVDGCDLPGGGEQGGEGRAHLPEQVEVAWDP